MSSSSGGPDSALQGTERVVVGRVRGVRGLKGELHVEPLTDSPTRFSPGSVLLVDDAPFRVERSRPGKAGLVVKLDSVNDRNAAEAMRGSLFTVSADAVAPLSGPSYYHFQIIDMEVRTDDGEPLGRVQEILLTGSNDVYLVRDEKGSETLIPSLSDVVLDVDLQRNRMTVRMPSDAP